MTEQYGKDFAELIMANRATYRDNNLQNDLMTWTTIKEEDIPKDTPILNSAFCSSKLLDEQKKRWMSCEISRHTASLNHIEGITAARY